jgi:hypothetical protein
MLTVNPVFTLVNIVFPLVYALPVRHYPIEQILIIVIVYLETMIPMLYAPLVSTRVPPAQ